MKEHIVVLVGLLFYVTSAISVNETLVDCSCSKGLCDNDTDTCVSRYGKSFSLLLVETNMELIFCSQEAVLSVTVHLYILYISL